jgi:hypothetical protein
MTGNHVIGGRVPISSWKKTPRKTDWFIDQIVYKLYGLTEEEIKIVEKACG